MPFWGNCVCEGYRNRAGAERKLERLGNRVPEAEPSGVGPGALLESGIPPP